MNSLEEEEYFANLESYSDDEPSSSKKPRKHKSYSVDFKVKVIEHAKKISTHSAADTYKIDRNTVRDWRKKEEALKEQFDQFSGTDQPSLRAQNVFPVQADHSITRNSTTNSRHGFVRKSSKAHVRSAPERSQSTVWAWAQSTAWAWAALPEELIRKSSKDCGITVNTDGTEDDMIHCFKPHGPVPGGREMLRQAREANANLEIDVEEGSRNGSSDSEQEIVIKE
ncbi:hypothetical protein Ddc_21345 [Ditylenchus destructor]|nr:hypothetical protein Ddc_21345 [Ditylenchus destructor]